MIVVEKLQLIIIKKMNINLTTIKKFDFTSLTR
jgi:hypothetical protein